MMILFLSRTSTERFISYWKHDMASVLQLFSIHFLLSSTTGLSSINNFGRFERQLKKTPKKLRLRWWCSSRPDVHSNSVITDSPIKAHKCYLMSLQPAQTERRTSCTRHQVCPIAANKSAAGQLVFPPSIKPRAPLYIFFKWPHAGISCQQSLPPFNLLRSVLLVYLLKTEA